MSSMNVITFYFFFFQTETEEGFVIIKTCGNTATSEYFIYPVISYVLPNTIGS